jgi:trk system potassium uptake protein TrkH
MVGSTSGGLKVIRYIVSYDHIKRLLKRLIYGHDYGHFEIDGIEYDATKSGLVLASITIYFLFIVFGTILIMIVSGVGVLPNGEVVVMSFSNAFSAAIANLGNIGPGISYTGNFNIGPAGNYYAFPVAGKIILIVLMYIGRVGVLAILMLFLKSRGEETFGSSVKVTKYDKNQPVLRQ